MREEKHKPERKNLPGSPTNKAGLRSASLLRTTMLSPGFPDVLHSTQQKSILPPQQFMLSEFLRQPRPPERGASAPQTATNHVQEGSGKGP